MEDKKYSRNKIINSASHLRFSFSFFLFFYVALFVPLRVSLTQESLRRCTGRWILALTWIRYSFRWPFMVYHKERFKTKTSRPYREFFPICKLSENHFPVYLFFLQYMNKYKDAYFLFKKLMRSLFDDDEVKNQHDPLHLLVRRCWNK